MPWTMKDAPAHTKKASSPAKKKVWSSTANAVLKKSGDDASAIRIANAQVKKSSQMKSKTSSKKGKKSD